MEEECSLAGTLAAYTGVSHRCRAWIPCQPRVIHPRRPCDTRPVHHTHQNMKLKSLFTLAATVFATSAFAGTPSKAPTVVQPAAEEPLGFTATIGYDSHYVFRGVLFA